MHRAGVEAQLTTEAASALADLLSRLATEPFRAAEVADLAAAGLSERDLGVATKLGLLLHVSRGIYLGPDAVELARQRLAEIAQPFTLSQARQAPRHDTSGGCPRCWNCWTGSGSLGDAATSNARSAASGGG